MIAIFLSTLSLRRATVLCYKCFYADLISIHALLAESDLLHPGLTLISPISIHALLAESDNIVFSAQRINFHFYPRSPCGERRQHYGSFHDLTVISIHALLAESDPWLPFISMAFFGISIHALLAESDCLLGSDCESIHNFYPRSPCGERLHRMSRWVWFFKFLSTLSLRRATLR